MNNEKLQYLKNNDFVEFDKEEIKKELIAKIYYGKRCFTEERADEYVNKYKYYRIMSDGSKVFYSEDYIANHTIDELETAFKRMD